MKLTKTQWIIVAVIAAVVIYIIFFRKKSSKSDESSYKIQCGQNETGTCVGCTPTTCPPESNTPGMQSHGCRCFDGACLPACTADGGSYVYNPSTGWTFVSRKRKRGVKKSATSSL